MTDAVATFVALAHAAPDFVDSLSDAEVAVLAYEFGVWRRPDQLIEDSPEWRSHGFVAGRGNGKTWGIGTYVNEAVEHGVYRDIGLCAPSEARVEQVQWATLIDTAPPWFRPEAVSGSLRWPNGVTATHHTPEEPGRPRGSNYDFVWATELVDWQASTRRELWNNVTTACRRGRAQYVWDTTSRGKHDLILELLAIHEANPGRHRLTRGTMFDNPVLTDDYLLDESRKYVGQEYDEEILGKIHTEAAGAQWKQEWIDRNRVHRPPVFEVEIIAIDPAGATGPQNDETGMVRVGRAYDRHLYPVADLSGKHTPEQWGDITLDAYETGCAGAVIERNHAGDKDTFVLRARAERRKIDVRVLEKDALFPRRSPGVFYVRETWSDTAKTNRASGPAALYDIDRVHHVGVLPKLEKQMTTWVPGSKSPNALDALAQAIIELARLDDNRRKHGGSRQAKGMAQARESLRQALRARATSARVG